MKQLATRLVLSRKVQRAMLALLVLPLLWQTGLQPAQAASSMSSDLLPGDVPVPWQLVSDRPSPAGPLAAVVVPPANPRPAAFPPAPQVEISAPLQAFIDQVVDGQPEQLVGVQVENVFALPVVQQPEWNAMYVDENPDTVTQFRLATQAGSTGILAHNFLAGALFYNLQVGQEVHLVYGDGAVRPYRINEIQEYQKLDPLSYTSRYVSLSSGKEMSTSELFQKVYGVPGRVVFQTCLEREGNASWGLTFVLATPMK